MTETTQTTPLRLPLRASRSRRWQVLPIIEITVLVIGALLPLVLKDYLTIYATRVLILCLFALSFDLVWGYAGIMSFGQAVFFGTAGYGVALIARDLGVTSILLVLPAGLLIGLAFALLLGGFLLLGRHPSSVIFVSLGTLTGSYAADRVARGWYYLGGQNGIPSIPPMSLGSYDITEGPVYYYLVLGILVLVYLAVPLPGAVAIRACAGGPARERAADRLLRLSGATPQGDHLFLCRRHRGARGQPLCLS